MRVFDKNNFEKGQRAKRTKTKTNKTETFAIFNQAFPRLPKIVEIMKSTYS